MRAAMSKIGLRKANCGVNVGGVSCDPDIHLHRLWKYMLFDIGTERFVVYIALVIGILFTLKGIYENT